MDANERQFVRLSQFVLDGIATDTERAELARLSAAHPELVTAIVDELMIDACLKWQSGSIVEDLPFLEGGARKWPQFPDTGQSQDDTTMELDDRCDGAHRDWAGSVELCGDECCRHCDCRHCSPARG